MNFRKLFNKYMANSSVNYEQARFIYNAAIDEALSAYTFCTLANINFVDHLEKTKAEQRQPNYFGDKHDE